MEYYLVKVDGHGYVGKLWRSGIGEIVNIDYVLNGLEATRCPMSDVWYNEKLKLEIEDYLESKNLPYELHILNYEIRHHYRPNPKEEF